MILLSSTSETKLSLEEIENDLTQEKAFLSPKEEKKLKVKKHYLFRTTKF